MGDPLRVADFFKGRTVYYPGCGFDNHAITVFAESRSCHCFLYSDYLLDVGSVSDLLSSDKFIPGYKSISIIPVDKSSFDSCLRINDRKTSNYSKDFSGVLCIFDRLCVNDFNFGAERIAVLFLIDDGIELYRDVYCIADGIRPPFAALIQDHGFGGNYSKFGRRGKLCDIALEYKVFPDFLLVGGVNNVWPYYSNMCFDFVIGGCHNSERLLFIRD